MKKLLQSLFILLFVAGTAMAQNRTITGTVTEKENGKPLPGVTVRIKGARGGTQTKDDGSYSLNVPNGGTELEFASLGYLTITRTIAAGAVINVALANDTQGLNEVVVTGYGVQKQRNITGSVALVGGKKIESLPVQTFDKALQGRAAGVQVTTNSGQPGSGISVRIRGVNTINGSTQPLYIVDGVQVSAGGLSTVTTQNVLGAINPADIESIQVLKDAASASIYGSQAANGVVIVTTKRGKSGRTQIRASHQRGVNSQLNPYDMMNSDQYYAIRKEAVVNRALRLGNPVDAAVTALNSTTFGTPTVPTALTSTNWYDQVFRDANFSTYDLSFSGGNEKTRFFLSGNYNDYDGVALSSIYKRGGLRANIDHKISEKFSLESNITLNYTNSGGPTTDAGFYVNTPFTGALFIPPTNTVYMPDGSYRNGTNLLGAQNFNIVQMVQEEQRSTKSFQTISNIALNYKVLPDLNIKAYAGIDFADAKNFSYRPASIPAYISTGGSGSESFIRNINYNTSLTANYTKTFNEDHNFSAIGGFEYRSAETTQVGASAQGFASPLFSLLSSAATPVSTTSTFTGFKLASFIGSLRYDYKGKYLLSGNLRYDGSSRFGADQKFGMFGGVSAGWRISDEEWLKSAEFLSDLKIRASYGVVGVQPIGDFQALSLYSSPGAIGAYSGGASIRPTQLSNPNLTWEQSKQTGLGLDFGFFNNRVTGAVDVYQKVTNRLLLNRVLPLNSGFSSVLENGGRLDGKGIDFELTTVNFDSPKGFRWSTSFNIAFTKNKLKELNAGATRIGTSYIVGEPTNILYSFKYAGVNPADGRPMFYDKNNNITYTPVANSNGTGDDRILGYNNPTSYGGLGNTFSYRGLTLDVMFQYQYGNSSYLQTGQITEASGMSVENNVVSQLDRWTTPGQITSVPRAYDGYTEPGGYDPTNLSSRYIQKASYIRLKQVTLNYKFPTAMTSKIGIPGISVFVQGMNLATITNYRGEDPENTGNNLNAYPNPRTISGGITLDL
jgi:TonB-linked SusC/RagA family outer membrane protein